jgi:hypothetical protein
MPPTLRKAACTQVSVPNAREVPDTRPVEGADADEELARLAKALVGSL